MSMRRHWYDTLRELVLRNEPVQATPLADPQAELDGQAEGADKCRTLLLSVEEDESLVVALPATAEEAQPLRRAAALDVVTLSGGQRWVGRCRVLGPVYHQLNDQRRVLALRLGPAEHVRSAQRREFFRAETAAIDMAPVRLTQVEPKPDDPAEPFEARLLNLSGGGIGIRLERSSADMICGGRRFACHFQLPADTEPIDVQVSLVHVEQAHERALYLGMAFDFASETQRRRIQDQIVRFTTELERKRLQRRRNV